MSENDFTPNADELLRANREAAETFDGADLAVRPTRKVAVIICMDARVDPYRVLGLANGEAHIIRNAGGVVTDDVIRSVCLSQRKLGTREVVLVHHTDCGLQTVSEDSFRDELEAETGLKPSWAVESFRDPFADVRQSIQRLVHDPFVLHKDHIRGFVYDVADGLLAEAT